MGIWEATNSTVEGVKRRLPDPAALKNAYASAYGIATASLDRARAISPDLSTASSICRQSINGGSNAAAWLYRTASVDAPQRVRALVSQPDDRIARTAWNLLDHTLEYTTRGYTGGIPVYRILKEGFSSGRVEKKGNEMSEMRRRLEKLEALAAAKGEDEAAVEGIVGSDVSRCVRRIPGANNPVDVIGSFMGSRIRGGDFIDKQVIPVIDKRRRRAREDFLLCMLC